MPKRWLSVRGHKEAKDGVRVTEDQFDFEFVTNSQEQHSPLTPVKARMNMFNGPSFKTKKSKQDLSPTQVSTSPKTIADKRLQLTKVEDSWIGVAFGSPTHPPSTMPGLHGNESTLSFKHSFSSDSSPPITSSYMAKCRKFSNLFKPKQAQMSISAPTQVCRIDGDQILDMPIATKPWRSPPPPEWVHSEHPESFATSLVGQIQEPACSNISISPPRPLRSHQPKLELQIPKVEMERYSVMFQDVAGIQQSKILQRRSRNLDPIKQLTDDEHDMRPIVPLKLSQARRPTTPTHQRKPSYTLFPSPQSLKDKTSESPNRQLPRRQLSFSERPRVSFDRSSPPLVDITINHQESRPTPERKISGMSSVSPDETIASSERDGSPWRSAASVHSAASSRTSFGSEIFFNLTPIRDSKGQSQYYFENLDSSDVEFAMSKSRKARKARHQRGDEDERAILKMSPDLQAAEFRLKIEEKWRLSMELNQAIAEVERMTSPLTDMLPAFELPLVVAPKPRPAPPPVPTTRELLPSIRLRRRLSGTMIGIPSPITERSEEFSPRSNGPSKKQTASRPLTRANPRPRQHIASLSVRPAPLKLVDEPQSPANPDFAITPPPVPIKDAKFIPISKFAGTSYSGPGPAVKLVELKTRPPHYHRRQRKPKRSATESNIVTQLSSFPAPPKERSRERPATMSGATTSGSALTQRPAYLVGVTHSQMLLSPKQIREAGIVAVAVQPTAEVSVARTVSLERKMSHQVLVMSPTLGHHSAINRKPVPPPTRPVPAIPTMKARAASGPLLSPVRCMSPTFHHGEKGHKHGASMNLVVERLGC